VSKTASGLSRKVLGDAAPVRGLAAWEAKGRRIWQTVNRSAWELGDWWNAGEPYGERVEIARRIGWEHQTCRNAGSVAGAFDVSRRRDTLSWGHHAEVAGLEVAEQEAWLDKAAKDGLSVMALRSEVRALPGHRRPIPALPAGTFNVLLADPPWRYEHPISDSRKIENQYPTLEVEEIAALEPPAAPDAVLFLWATVPMNAKALDVMEAWGFEYRTGYWTRGRHELLLVGVRGQPVVPDAGDKPDSVIEAPRGKHSEKPSEVYDLIETAFPEHAYLELFARTGREGWASWGNEIG
jgi:N6-adenosine-specific RNA methylase IME4